MVVMNNTIASHGFMEIVVNLTKYVIDADSCSRKQTLCSTIFIKEKFKFVLFVKLSLLYSVALFEGEGSNSVFSIKLFGKFRAKVARKMI